MENEKKINFLCENFHIFLKITLEEIVWMKKTMAVMLVKRTIFKLLELREKNRIVFEESIICGRFDKISCNLENTIIIGDDGGLYCL